MFILEFSFIFLIFLNFYVYCSLISYSYLTQIAHNDMLQDQFANFSIDTNLFSRFYSLQVLFALYEKNIPCTLHEVDVSNGEQCSNWFMEMNPKMEVPVLQNETLIVPSSSQIVNYIEANFKEISLLPTDDRHIMSKVILFNRKISQIPIGIISLGTFIHSEIVSSPKLPFVGPLRKSFLSNLNILLKFCS